MSAEQHPQPTAKPPTKIMKCRGQVLTPMDGPARVRLPANSSMQLMGT